jgi:predicted aconitase
LADSPLADPLKSLGAAMAASGAVALYHIAGLTPESRTGNVLAPDAKQIAIDDLSHGYRALQSNQNSRDEKPNINEHTQIDLVSIGCPHASPNEISQIAQTLTGKKLHTPLWVTTARETKEQMVAQVEMIQAAGGQVIADTCLVVAPIQELDFHTMATNSAKMATYTPSHSGLRVRFGSLAQCIEAATTGVWPSDSLSSATRTESP